MAGGARPLDTGERRVLDLLLAGDFDGVPALREQARVPPLWAIATADARPCTWPRTLMLHLPLARAAYSIGAGRCFARGFDRDSRALPQLVAAAGQVGGLGGGCPPLRGFFVRPAGPLGWGP